MSLEIEITNKEDALAALSAVVAFVESLPEGEATESSSEETTEDSSEESTTEASTEAEVTLPSAADLADKEVTSKEQIPELAAKLGLTTTDKKVSQLRAELVTLATIAEEGEVEDAALNALAESLGLTPDKKSAKTLAAIKEWLAAQGSEGETSTEEETTATTDDDEESTPAASDDDEDEAPVKSDDDEDDNTESTEETTEESSEDTTEAAAAEPDSDGVDRAKVSKSFKKFPDLKTMVARLTAFNKAAKTKIAFDAKKEPAVKDAYRKLVAELVTSNEDIAEWGVPYFRDNGGWCCGLEMDTIKVKGQKNACGRCAVTKKAFALNDAQDEFVSIKA